MVCWVCKVEDITGECRREGGSFSEDGQNSWVTLWGSLCLHSSGGQLALGLLVRTFSEKKYA